MFIRVKNDNEDLIDFIPSDMLIDYLDILITGLNLIRATIVIIYKPVYNPTRYKQAPKRAYRLDQKKPVFVYYLHHDT